MYSKGLFIVLKLQGAVVRVFGAFLDYGSDALKGDRFISPQKRTPLDKERPIHHPHICGPFT